MHNRQKLQELLNNIYKQSEHKDKPQSQLPDRCGFAYYDLKLDDNTFIVNDAVIKKIRFLLSNRLDLVDDHFIPSMGYVTVTIANASKSKITKTVPPEWHDTLKNYLEALGCKQEYSFSHRNLNALEWREQTMSSLYIKYRRDNPEEHYKVLHQHIADSIIHLAREKKLDKLNIVDGGCGNGKLIKLIEEKCEQNQILAHLLAFDFNPENIKECPSNTKVKYIQGNLLHLNSLLDQAKQEKWLEEKYDTVLILSGSLTRLVLHNSFEAAQVLQNAFLSNVKYIIGGGQTTPLINSFLLKRTGYSYSPIPGNNTVAHHFFSLQQMSEVGILNNKINKINSRNILDLTLCPNPDRLLTQLNLAGHIKNELTIDLSFCFFTDKTIQILIDLHKTFPKLKLICWHNDPITIDLFKKHLCQLFKITDARLVDNEGYVIGAREYFLSLEPRYTLFQPVDSKKTMRVNYQALFNDICEAEDFITIDRYFQHGNRDYLVHLLLRAAVKGSVAIALYMLNKQPDLVTAFNDFPDFNFSEPLIKALIKENNKDLAGKVAIYFDAKNNFSIIQMLEDAEINPSQLIDDQGNTLAHRLVNSYKINSKKTLAFLKKYPALINMQNKNGHIPLYYFLKQNHNDSDLVNYLISESKLDVVDREGVTLLDLVVAMKDLDAVNKIIKKHP